MIKFGVVIFLLSLGTIVINAVLVISFVATKQWKKNLSNTLIFMTSIVDLMNGLIGMPLIGIAYCWQKLLRYKVIHVMTYFVFHCLSSINSNLTILIGIDRYFHMNPDFINRRSSRFQKYLKKPRVYVVILLIVILSVAFCLSYALLRVGNYITTMVYANIVTSIAISSLITALVVIYTRGYCKVRRHVEENQARLNSIRDGESGVAIQPRYVKELQKTVLLLLIAACGASAPQGILCIAAAILLAENPNAFDSLEIGMFQSTALSVSMSGTITNALIVLYRNRKCREWLRNKRDSFLRCCCCFKSQDQEVDIENSASVINNITVNNA